MSTLFVVATPIGNLEDVSLRALRVLGEVSLVAAEDTRTARIVLDRYRVTATLLSYNDHNAPRRIPEILDRLAAADVALVTDAGTPAISDPGVELVAAARAAGHTVVAVPGPSAPIAALSIAGLATGAFVFLGFLPRQAAARRRIFEAYATRTETLVAFESPPRLRATLTAIAATLPERRLAVCRELTKLHEEVFAGTAEAALAHFAEPRGEFVLVIEGASETKAAPDADREAAARVEVSLMRRIGLTRAQAAALLEARYGLSRRQLYALWLQASEPPAAP